MNQSASPHAASNKYILQISDTDSELYGMFTVKKQNDIT